MSKLFNWPKPKEKDVSEPVITLINKLKVLTDWRFTECQIGSSTYYNLINNKDKSIIVNMLGGLTYSPYITNMPWLTTDERELLTYEVWNIVGAQIKLKKQDQRKTLMDKLNKC